jgi:FkbM family methyltransferase
MALLGPAPQPGTFVDVGANGGWETRLALAAGMNVLAVECLPEAYQELRVIFHGMPAARLRLLHACASNSTGVATLHRAADSSSMVLNNVRSGPEALKAGKERTKESQVHSVVLDSELLPTGTPDSASLRVDVRLVKIDTQVAPRHRTLLQENQIPHCRLPPPPYVSSIALLPIPCGRGTSCSCYPGCVALSARGDLSSFTRTTKWRLLHLQRLKRCCRPRH